MVASPMRARPARVFGVGDDQERNPLSTIASVQPGDGTALNDIAMCLALSLIHI